MPTALKADWDLIRHLYLSGTPLDTIVKETGVAKGTIASRANRANWKRTQAAAKSIVQTPTAPVDRREAREPAIDIEHASKTVRSRAAKAISSALDTLTEPGDWKTAARQQSQLEPLIRNARTVFGWGDDATTSSVRISILAQCVVSDGPSQNKHSFPAALGPDAPGGPLLTRGGAIDTPSKNFPILDISASPVADVAKGEVDSALGDVEDFSI